MKLNWVWIFYQIRLLRDFRGYKQGLALFSSFPDEVSWRRALLSGEELSRVRYIDYSYYNILFATALHSR